MRQCKKRVLRDRFGELLGGAVEFFGRKELLAVAVELQRLAPALRVGELLRIGRDAESGREQDGDDRAAAVHSHLRKKGGHVAVAALVYREGERLEFEANAETHLPRRL